MMSTVVNCYWKIDEDRDRIITEVESVLSEIYKLKLVRKGAMIISPESYDQRRSQYLASKIIKDLRLESEDDGYRLVLVDVDLYAPGLNFIFGQADQLDLIAIVSLFRLKGDRLLSRLRTEVVHEIGHLMGLDHCRSRKCVMFFSNSIIDTDYKGERLCSFCRRRLNGTL